MIPQYFYVILLFLGCLASLISLREKLKKDFTSFNKFNKSDPHYSENFLNNISLYFNLSENFISSALKENLLNSNDFFKYKRYFVWNVTDSSKSQDIYILGLFETESRPKWEGLSEIVAAQLAVEHINKYQILPGFSLKLLNNDTKCDPGIGLNNFFHTLYSNKTIVMLLAGTCSDVTETLASVVPFWNIIQMSYGSASPVLSDKEKFPLFFRTVAVASSHNSARIAFIKHFKWETVVIFSQSEENYLLSLSNFVSELEAVNVSCVATITFSLANLREQLKVLKELDVRIIIGSFSSDVGTKVFCEAYGLEILGGEYVWMLQYEDLKLWNIPNKCELQHLLTATEGIFFVSDHNTLVENTTSIYNLSNEDFEKELKDLNATASKYAPLAYDAVWTMAFTLREALDHGRFSPMEFTYENNWMVQSFLHIIKRMRFIGISGPVIFKGADRIGNTMFKQMQSGKLNDVALFNPFRNVLDFACKACKKIKWKEYQVPLARRILRKQLLKVPNLAFYTILVVSCLGIICSAAFLYFNLHFRKMKTVKLSSPRITNIAITGCIVVYITIPFLGMDSSYLPSKRSFSYLCMARAYLLSAGFSLTFGSLFAKTYRVRRIFTYSRRSLIKDKLLKDKPLIAFVCLLLVIDGFVIILWSVVDPMHYSLENLPLEIDPKNKAVVYQSQVEICQCENRLGWFITVYGYKGMVLLMVVYMAWETRRIKIAELNDSQYIAICVYSVLSSALIIILTNFVSPYSVISYLTTAVSILISTTIIVIVLFLPKLKSIFGHANFLQDPIEKSMGLKTEYNTRRFLVDDPRDLIYRFEAQNRVYKTEIEILDKEIARLERQLLQYSRLVNRSTPEPHLKHKPESCINTISKGTRTGRASWPTEIQCNINQDPQYILSGQNDGKWIFNRLIFGSISRIWHSKTEAGDPHVRTSIQTDDTKLESLSTEQNDDDIYRIPDRY